MNSKAFSILFMGLSVVLSIAICPGVLAAHYDAHDPQALKEDPRLAPGQLAPVLGGLGDHHHEITTASDRAQLFFDQGLKLTFGFNHKEALRSFKEAARLDPDCAMAYWGWALVLGPNLNLPMSPRVAEQAYEAIRLALDYKNNVTQRERDYIDALAKRYTNDPLADRTTLDTAYAEAMGALHAKYPDDSDAATLYAAALMNLSPWNYWTKDGRPNMHTPTILVTLEAVIEREPKHMGALHYYIHAVEPVDPDRGASAADALRNLAPGAGHLVHMPSHIYMQIGRYAESYDLNRLAAGADEAYISQCRAQGIYPLNYYPHNLHFQTWAAQMLGNSKKAVEAAQKVAANVPKDLHGNDWALYQTFLSMPLATYVRFGKWQAVLAEPAPPGYLNFLTGIRHYARGLAYTHTGRLQEAGQELSALAKIARDPAVRKEPIGFGSAETLLTIAREALAGELAAKQGNYDQALARLKRAIRLQDSLPYNEPPSWYYPLRHTLGAVLLEAGYPVEAEAVYRQDLNTYRDNGYALYGLWQSLKAQSRRAEAERVKARFETAWAHADIALSTSRF